MFLLGTITNKIKKILSNNDINFNFRIKMERPKKELITRLSNYRRVLFKMKALGFTRVFSDNLADSLGTSPIQVRKDFSEFKLSGNKKGGYKIDELLEGLSKILGKNKLQKVIIVGCGRMGKTLMYYHGFSVEGLRIVAGFDPDPATIDKEANIPIYDILDLPEFVKKVKIEVAILTVPEHVAPTMTDKLERAGIKGILNFAPVQIHSTENCLIRNINIALELENMFYFVNSKNAS